MSDATFVRRLAGASFARADTRRDERAAEPHRPVEDLLRSLRGWLPAAREPLASIAMLAKAVQAAHESVKPLPDADVASVFARSVAGNSGGRDALRTHSGLPAVLACVAEASRRRIGLWPHPVQLAGTRSLLAGELAELQTGEGKTLVAAMAACVMAATGAQVHVISTNDYLARRDCEEMGPLLRFFALDAGFIQGGMSADERRRAYAHPVCYAAGKEVVFDYLKDRVQGHGIVPVRVARLHDLLASPEQIAASPPLIPALHYAIVDEADSVLIDEARTPMILSRDAPPVFPPELLVWAISAAAGLTKGVHFRIGNARDLDLLPRALADCGPVPPGVAPVWQSRSWREHLLRQALTALHLYYRDQHYIITDGKVQIVDESTGRVMPDRSWEHGLHQLIETKEGVEVTSGRETLQRMTYQRFFRRYYLVAGLTGTAAEASRELWSVYRLPVRRIPPNRPNRRVRWPDRCEPTIVAKWQAVAESAIEIARRGQPVLIGTRSVLASEQIAAELTRHDVAHVVLNARQDAEEAAIVAQAGQSGRITVATNMAGRGTDIRLDAAALAAGGLHVILTEFHESPRIDRQLFGRSGRQGEPGTAQAIVSAEDGLFETLPRAWRAGLAHLHGRRQRALLRWLVRQAQSKAERRAYQTRLQTMRQDKELRRTIGFAGRVT